MCISYSWKVQLILHKCYMYNVHQQCHCDYEKSANSFFIQLCKQPHLCVNGVATPDYILNEYTSLIKCLHCTCIFIWSSFHHSVQELRHWNFVSRKSGYYAFWIPNFIELLYQMAGWRATEYNHLIEIDCEARSFFENEVTYMYIETHVTTK